VHRRGGVFCYGIIVMHDVLVCTLWEICNSDVLHESVMFGLKPLDGIKCCVRFSVPRNPVKTFSPV